MEAESERASGNTRAAAGDDRLIAAQARFQEALLNLFRWQNLPRLRIRELIRWEIEAPRNMPGSQPGPRLGGGAGIARGAPRIDHLLALCGEIGKHLRAVAHALWIEGCGEARGSRLR